MPPNVHPVGRNGMHNGRLYNNQDHSMYTAMLTVENIHGATHDILGRERRRGVPRARESNQGPMPAPRTRPEDAPDPCPAGPRPMARPHERAQHLRVMHKARTVATRDAE